MRWEESPTFPSASPPASNRAFPSCQLEVFPSESHLKPCSSCPLSSQVMAHLALTFHQWWASIKQPRWGGGPSASSCRQSNPLSAKSGAAKAFQFQHLMGNGKTSPPSPFPYLDSLNPQVATCQHNAALLLLKDSAPSRTCAHTSFISPQRLAGRAEWCSAQTVTSVFGSQATQSQEGLTLTQTQLAILAPCLPDKNAISGAGTSL